MLELAVVEVVWIVDKEQGNDWKVYAQEKFARFLCSATNEHFPRYNHRILNLHKQLHSRVPTPKRFWRWKLRWNALPNRFT